MMQLVCFLTSTSTFSFAVEYKMSNPLVSFSRRIRKSGYYLSVYLEVFEASQIVAYCFF